MKEIKAFIRPECMDPVVHALADAGIQSMTVVPVQALATVADDAEHPVDQTFIAPYSDVHKLELVCRDQDMERVLRLIAKLGRTGKAGDGIVYVSSVDRILKIRTGVEGDQAVDRMT